MVEGNEVKLTLKLSSVKIFISIKSESHTILSISIAVSSILKILCLTNNLCYKSIWRKGKNAYDNKNGEISP